MASIPASTIRKRNQALSTKRSGPWGAQRTVAAAICYRTRPLGELEFLLVRTRAGRWIFPKGAVDGDPSAAAGAAREAFEEAGVIGRVEPVCLTRFLHGSTRRGTHLVRAHLCEVKQLVPSTESYRFPTWFSAEMAKRRLRLDRPGPMGNELERVVDIAVRRLTRS